MGRKLGVIYAHIGRPTSDEQRRTSGEQRRAAPVKRREAVRGAPDKGALAAIDAGAARLSAAGVTAVDRRRCHNAPGRRKDGAPGEEGRDRRTGTPLNETRATAKSQTTRSQPVLCVKGAV